MFRKLQWSCLLVGVLTATSPLLGEQPKKEGKQRVDLHGDALPDGAVARMGTLRWRATDSIECVAFSPDGSILACGEQDGSISLWEVKTGSQIRRFMGPGGPVGTVTFSPDGKTLASSNRNRKVGLWDVASGRELLVYDSADRGLQFHNYCLVFAPDGKTLVSSATRVRKQRTNNGDEKRVFDAVIQLRDVESGKVTRQFESPSSIVLALAYSPDGKILAAGLHKDYVEKDHPKKAELPAGTRFEGVFLALILVIGPVTARQGALRKQLAFFLVLGCAVLVAWWFLRDAEEPNLDGAIQLWDMSTGEPLRKLGKKDDRVRSLAFSPDGKVLASGCEDKSAHLYKVSTGRQLHQLDAGARPVRDTDQLRQLQGSVSVLFSADGKSLVTACLDRTVLVWDPSTGKQIRQLPEQFHPQSVALSRDGLLVVATGSIRSLQLWDISTGKAVTQAEGSPGLIRSLSFSPDGKTLAAAGMDIRLWEAATGKSIRQLPGRVRVAYSPDGKLLACGGSDYTLRLHEVATGRELHRFPASHSGYTYPAAAAFSPDGKLLAAEGSRTLNAPFGLWELETRQLSPHLDKMKTQRPPIRAEFINSMAFSPDGKALAWASRDRVVLLPLSPEQDARSLEYKKARAVSFSADSKLIAVAGGTHGRGRGKSEMGVHILDAESGQLVRHVGEQVAQIRVAAYSPDGKTLVGGSSDGIVRLWEAASGKLLHEFRGHRGPIWCVAFSPDGRTFASGSEDSTVLLWEVHAAGKASGSR